MCVHSSSSSRSRVQMPKRPPSKHKCRLCKSPVCKICIHAKEGSGSKLHHMARHVSYYRNSGWCGMVW